MDATQDLNQAQGSRGHRSPRPAACRLPTPPRPHPSGHGRSILPDPKRRGGCDSAPRARARSQRLAAQSLSRTGALSQHRARARSSVQNSETPRGDRDSLPTPGGRAWPQLRPAPAHSAPAPPVPGSTWNVPPRARTWEARTCEAQTWNVPPEARTWNVPTLPAAPWRVAGSEPG